MYIGSSWELVDTNKEFYRDKIIKHRSHLDHVDRCKLSVSTVIYQFPALSIGVYWRLLRGS